MVSEPSVLPIIVILQLRNNYDCQRQNVQKIPASNVPPLLGLSYHFPYNCSNGSEIYQKWSLYIVDQKLYKAINRLNICHYSSNGDLSCIFVWFENIKTVSFVDV